MVGMAVGSGGVDVSAGVEEGTGVKVPVGAAVSVGKTSVDAEEQEDRNTMMSKIATICLNFTDHPLLNRQNVCMMDD